MKHTKYIDECQYDGTYILFHLPGTDGITRPCTPRSMWFILTEERFMKQSIVHVAVVVRDYDEAVDFYVNKLNFELLEDTYQPEQNKRWVVVAPKGGSGTTILLARASDEEQKAFVGNQTGGRVFLFLNTDDFWRDYNEYRSKGIEFVREPKTADYGTVAVFKDLYGNLWDLLQFTEDHHMMKRI